MDPEVKAAEAEVVTTTETTEPQTTEPAAATTEEAKPELVKLADGREVTPEELRSLYEDKLLPEFTRRSQELKKYESQNKPATETPKNDPWIPQSYDEILEKAEQRVSEKFADKLQFAERLQLEQQAREQLASTIEVQLSEVKKTDPNLNESQLFQHATKYGFGDLRFAYQNMKDMNLAIQSTEQRVAKDLARRAGTPIAGTPQSGTASGEGIEYNPNGPKETPQEYLRRIKQQ